MDLKRLLIKTLLHLSSVQKSCRLSLDIMSFADSCLRVHGGPVTKSSFFSPFLPFGPGDWILLPLCCSEGWSRVDAWLKLWQWKCIKHRPSEQMFACLLLSEDHFPAGINRVDTVYLKLLALTLWHNATLTGVGYLVPNLTFIDSNTFQCTLSISHMENTTAKETFVVSKPWNHKYFQDFETSNLQT